MVWLLQNFKMNQMKGKVCDFLILTNLFLTISFINFIYELENYKRNCK